jgi:CheY-like chemotaxis protein/two-component sensor histidine kinase
MSAPSIQPLRSASESLQLEALRGMQGELISKLAHDVRNPLSSVQYAIEMLRLESAPSGEALRAMEILERQVGELSRLLEEGIDVMRISLGQIQLRKQEVDFADIVAGAAVLNRPLFSERKQRLAVALPTERLLVEGDSTRLTQVVSNLLHNAARFTNSGGEIRLSASREETEIELRVEDSGVGIEAEMLPRLFDLVAKRDPARVGFGMGLRIVRTLVELHGGSVTAFSEGLGHGSTFVVRLPRALEAERRIGEQTSALTALLEQTARRILIVAESADFGEEWSMLLRIAGHEVRTETTASSLAEFAAAFAPHVVLLDMSGELPSGFSASQVRNQPGMENLLVVAMHADGKIDRRRAEEMGCDVVLAKPVRVTDFLKLLAERVSAVRPAETS